MEKNYFTKKIKTLIFIVSFSIILIVGFTLFQFQLNKMESEFEFNVKYIIKKDIDNKIIDYFIDTTPEKQNKFMPGKNIMIKRYNKKLVNIADYIFLGAWNFQNEIFKKERKYIKKGGKFITHVPYPKIIK